MRVDDAFDECCSDGGVDSIAATSEDSRTGGGGEVMLRRQHRAPAHNERVNCTHLGNFFLRSNFITRLNPRSEVRPFVLAANFRFVATRIQQKGACIRTLLLIRTGYGENRAGAR